MGSLLTPESLEEIRREAGIRRSAGWRMPISTVDALLSHIDAQQKRIERLEAVLTNISGFLDCEICNCSSCREASSCAEAALRGGE